MSNTIEVDEGIERLIIELFYQQKILKGAMTLTHGKHVKVTYTKTFNKELRCMIHMRQMYFNGWMIGKRIDIFSPISDKEMGFSCGTLKVRLGNPRSYLQNKQLFTTTLQAMVKGHNPYLMVNNYIEDNEVIIGSESAPHLLILDEDEYSIIPPPDPEADRTDGYIRPEIIELLNTL